MCPPSLAAAPTPNCAAYGAGIKPTSHACLEHCPSGLDWRLRRLGLEVLVPLWRHAASKSEATRSRWQWTWVGDDSVFKKYGDQLGLVGTWWSGQEHRVLSGLMASY